MLRLNNSSTTKGASSSLGRFVFKEEEKDDKTIVTTFVREMTENRTVPAASAAIDGREKVSCSSRKRRRSNIYDKDREREKRATIGRVYSQLRDLVPSVSPTESRIEIVDKAIQYVLDLKEEIRKLEKRKILCETATSHSETCSNGRTSVSFTVSNKLVFFAIKSTTLREKLASEILMVFERCGVEVLAANVSVHLDQLLVAVTGLVVADYGAVEMIQREILIL